MAAPDTPVSPRHRRHGQSAAPALRAIAFLFAKYLLLAAARARLLLARLNLARYLLFAEAAAALALLFARYALLLAIAALLLARYTLLLAIAAFLFA